MSVHSNENNISTSGDSESMNIISGRCLCGGVTWSIPSTNVQNTQILVCHCSYCRQQSGSLYIPWLALPRDAVFKSIKNHDSSSSSSLLTYYAVSEVAKRGFCKGCGSSMFMDYNEQHTIWASIGSFDSKSYIPSIIEERDSHIFVDSKGVIKEEDLNNKLPRLEGFGTYRPDPCSTSCFVDRHPLMG